jgi:RHS repeat-associated protein
MRPAACSACPTTKGRTLRQAQDRPFDRLRTGGTNIETFSHTCDTKGQRLSKTMSGSIQETPFNARCDAAKRMRAITAGVKYDALERRVEKTVNGQSIGFVYDGAQAIGEVTGGAISTSVLTGLAVDEVIARYSQSGNRTLLTDALGSVIAQTKDDQSVQNFYAYSPYGQGQTLGTDEANPIQYTGRENDQTGLLYYRARYYDPVLKRFISEDPIGLAGGPNVYAYVDGSPVNLVDPTGNASTCYSAGPNCSGVGPPGGVYRTPPDGSCQKPMWKGGFITEWEDCNAPVACRTSVKPREGPNHNYEVFVPGSENKSTAADSGAVGRNKSAGPKRSFFQCVMDKSLTWSTAGSAAKFVGKEIAIHAGVHTVKEGLNNLQRHQVGGPEFPYRGI